MEVECLGKADVELKEEIEEKTKRESEQTNAAQTTSKQINVELTEEIENSRDKGRENLKRTLHRGHTVAICGNEASQRRSENSTNKMRNICIT